MPDSQQRALCAVCGLPLPQGELAARCPHCLLSLALDDSTDDSGATPAQGKAERARPRYFADFELLEILYVCGMVFFCLSG
jgi:hypothetical protein